LLRPLKMSVGACNLVLRGDSILHRWQQLASLSSSLTISKKAHSYRGPAQGGAGTSNMLDVRCSASRSRLKRSDFPFLLLRAARRSAICECGQLENNTNERTINRQNLAPLLYL
jgi:hypothetical protein